MQYNRIVELWRAPLIEDAYGTKRDWANAVRVVSKPASFQPVYVTEADVDRETTYSIWNVYMWPVDAEATDRALIDDEWYEMDGEPMLRDHFRRIARTRLRLRKVRH